MASWANRSFTVIWKDENDAEIESSQGVCPVASSLVYLASGYLLGSIWVCSILATITKWLLLWLNKVWVSFSWSIVKLQCSISFKYIGKWFRDQISCSVVSDSLRPHESQHARPPCPSPTPGVHSDHVHWVSDAIQPSHPLSSSSPPVPNPSQHQSLFQWVNSSHEVAKVHRYV